MLKLYHIMTITDSLLLQFKQKFLAVFDRTFTIPARGVILFVRKGILRRRIRVNLQMAINKAMRTVLKALSYGDINVQSSRAFANIKEAIDPLKRFYRTIDTKIYNGDYGGFPPASICPAKSFLPGTEWRNTLQCSCSCTGGGWITESVDTYDRTARGLPGTRGTR